MGNSQNPSDGELSKDVDLQEAYNKLCKVAAKDAMSVELGLKKIASLKLEKKILLVKLFDANELLNNVRLRTCCYLIKLRIWNLNYLLLENKQIGLLVPNLIIC